MKRHRDVFEDGEDVIPLQSSAGNDGGAKSKKKAKKREGEAPKKNIMVAGLPDHADAKICYSTALSLRGGHVLLFGFVAIEVTPSVNVQHLSRSTYRYVHE